MLVGDPAVTTTHVFDGLKMIQQSHATVFQSGCINLHNLTTFLLLVLPESQATSPLPPRESITASAPVSPSLFETTDIEASEG